MKRTRTIFLWLALCLLILPGAPAAISQRNAETPMPLSTAAPTETLTPAAVSDAETPTVVPSLAPSTPTDDFSDTSSSLTPLQRAPTPTATATLAETSSATILDALVEKIFAAMSPSDRVGQLFIVTLNGSDVSFESHMTELIYGYRIGGVTLRPQNYNFSNEPGTDTPRQVAVLANQLQATAYGVLLPADQALQPVPNQPWPPSNFVSLEQETGVAPPNIPLLIAVEQLGDNLPGTALRRGFTPLPSQLAIGSTWNVDLAQSVGAVVGRELRSVGVNLLLGPTLDVLDQPRSDIVGSLGLFSFGGDPFWVGQLGRAYIAGVHTGSQGRVATIVRHFPGQGDIDRLPDDEVATIPKNLDELMRIAVPPFLAVTNLSPDGNDPAMTDGLMSSNMGFVALQGGAGPAVPFGLDTSLAQSLNQPHFALWRSGGGVVMSGSLGSPAIRKAYDPTLADLPGRLIALDAFAAGNDLLFLDRFSHDDNWRNELNNIRAVIALFQERYRTDPDFALQVDEAVRRILKLKLRLYDAPALPLPEQDAPLIPLSRVLVQEDDLAALTASSADANQIMTTVAREALIQLHPDPARQAPLSPPRAGEKILIVTDSRLQQECVGCTAEVAVDPDQIARIILTYYGPEGTGQIQPEQLTSITFADLRQVLETGLTSPAPVTPVVGDLPAPTTPTESTDQEIISSLATPEPGKSERIEQAIVSAQWLIFAMLDITPQRPNSEALRMFLSQRSEQLTNKNVVVFALNAPYFLDTTEISKLVLYYGVGSKTEPFLESAVRALFRNFTPTGAPSVSVPGTRYKSLQERLRPDPGLQIPLRLLSNEATLIANTEDTAERSAPPVISAGQVVRIDVGPIVDANGHPVPDGIVVNFDLRFEGADLALAVPPATTQGGLATRAVRLDRGGVLSVSAAAGEATSGEPLRLNVIELQPTPTTLIEPTPTANALLAVNATNAITLATASTPPPIQSSSGTDWNVQRVNAVTLLLSLLAVAVTLSLILLTLGRIRPRRQLFVGMLWAIVAGLACYLLYGMGWLPGGESIAAVLNVFGAPAVVLFAMAPPLLWTWLGSSR